MVGPRVAACDIDLTSRYDHANDLPRRLVLAQQPRGDGHDHECRKQLGEHVVVPDKTPLANLWLTLLKGAGVKAEQHGDSTGVVKALSS